MWTAYVNQATSASIPPAGAAPMYSNLGSTQIGYVSGTVNPVECIRPTVISADSTNPESWIAKGISGSATLQGYVHGSTGNANE